jgi:AcrR family transcriptional regulator
VSSEPALRSGSRSRTQSAILAAAAAVLAKNPVATMPEIAEAAAVGRTTVHRYFADRNTLIRAATADAIRALDQAIDDVAPEQGSALDAMRRVITAMVSAADRILFLFSDPRVLQQYPDLAPSAAPAVLQLIERGQAEGVFDAELSATWIQHSLWALVYRGCEDAEQGELPRHEVARVVARTLEYGIRARGET